MLAICANDDTPEVENEFVFPTMPDMREFANEYGFHIVDIMVDLHVSYAVDRSTGGWTF